MAQTIINVGVIANDGTGDGIRLAGTSINTNFTELFNRPSVLSHIAFDGNNITSTLSNADIVLGTVGFGMGLTAAPIMLTRIDPITVVVSLNTIGLIMYSLSLYQNRTYLEIRSTTPIAFAGVLAVPVGVFLLTILNIGLLRLSISFGIMIFAIGFILNLSYTLPKFRGLSVMIGFVVGLMLVTLGIGGPILVIFLLSRKTSNETYRANLAYYMMIVELGCIGGYIFGGLFSVDIFILIGIMIIPVLIGYSVSKSIAKRLNETTFRHAVSVVIIAGSLVVIGKEVFSYIG